MSVQAIQQILHSLAILPLVSRFTWSVGCAHYEDLFPSNHTIHLCQQLVHNTGAGTALNTGFKKVSQSQKCIILLPNFVCTPLSS